MEVLSKTETFISLSRFTLLKKHQKPTDYERKNLLNDRVKGSYSLLSQCSHLSHLLLRSGSHSTVRFGFIFLKSTLIMSFSTMYPRPSCLVSIFGQPVLRKQILVINYNKFIFLYEKSDVKKWAISNYRRKYMRHQRFVFAVVAVVVFLHKPLS